MTPKTSTHFRLSAATTEKLAALADRYGTRTTAVEVAIDRLYQDNAPDTSLLEEVIRNCAKERDLNFDASVSITPERVTIDTRISRNPSRSHNAGDYHYWMEFFLHRGHILAELRCSCDFWQPWDEPRTLFPASYWPQFVANVRSLATAKEIPVD